MEVGFDVISDLNLSPSDNFKWTHKATSLYCIIAGNISSDTRTIIQTLGHLSKYYQGIFYTPGNLEYKDSPDIDYKTQELSAICEYIDGVTLLHNNVAMIDGIAVVGANGWGSLPEDYILENIQKLHEREYDLQYLRHTIQKLQLYLDVKKIVVATGTVPRKDLFFGQTPEHIETMPDFTSCIQDDTEKKLSHWVFGSYGNVVDVTKNNINYISNPYDKSKNYWAKRLAVKI